MAGSPRGEGPWGGRALADVAARLRKGWPAGLTVLFGDDLYHLDRALGMILDHLVPDRADSFAWTVLGDAPAAAGALVAQARATGMFASRRVVFLRDVATLEGEPEPLIEFAKSPPREGFIVVRAPKLDRKRKLHKALAEAGTTLTFRAPANRREEDELRVEATAMARERGLAVGRDALEMLLAVCGVDLQRIVGELDKLRTWSGVTPGATFEIDAAAVRDIAAGDELMTGWELADALLERNREKAVVLARRLVDSGQEPIKVVGGLAYRARTLIEAKALAARGMSAEEVASRQGGAWFFKAALSAGMERYSLAEALAMPGRLLAADRAFKSRAIDKGAVLEATVAQLTAPAPKGRR